MIDKKHTVKATLGAALAAALVTACASLIGAEDPIHASAEFAADAASEGAAAPDADIVGGNGGDVAGACAEQTPSDAVAAYVTPAGSSAADCGPLATPCGSVQSAVDHLRGKGTVYLAAGTYIEQVKLRGGVTVSGGWNVANGAWARGCGVDAAKAIIEAPAGMNKTIIADSLGGEASLVELTIRSHAANPAPGESIYGVFALGNITTPTSLTLNDVIIEMKDGGPGVPGKTGPPGNPAPAAGPPPAQVCTASATQATPAAANPGAGSQAGLFSATGYDPGAGAVGAGGATGKNGTLSLSACITTCQSCDTNNACIMPSSAACGTGYAGCGGPGGTGGTGGAGGGGSFGLYAWGASVKVLGGTLHGGAGGNGGGGGAGGAGAPGGSGATGVDATCNTACTAKPGKSCAATTPQTSVASKGGTGGMGGQGGQGGGGAGGPSCLLYIGDGATGSVDQTRLEPGLGGPGGLPGGAPGVSRASCP